MSNIVFLDPIDLEPADRNAIADLGKVTFHPDAPADQTEVAARMADHEIAVSNFVPIQARAIGATPSLKYIVAASEGYDRIDLASATAHGIGVLNCPGYSTNAVAEHTLMLILACLKNAVKYNEYLLSGKWQPDAPLQNAELRGKKVLVVGYGKIGKRVAELCTGLGAKVKVCNSQTTDKELDDLLSKADIVSLHLPLTEKTKHLIDARRIGLMKPGAYLINTSRGAVIEQSALLSALIAEKIAGVGLDVFTNEPIGTEPINKQILEISSHRNTVASQHIAFKTTDAIHNLGIQIIENIKACLEGRPINMVNQIPQ